MLKVAIIGSGAISNAHIEAYLQFPDRCQIVAISDIYVEKAQERIDHYGLNAKAVKDYKELLTEEIDLISICTPPYTHASLAVECMEANMHVMVEKPMASSLEECDLMNEAARRTGKLLSIVAQNRFKTPMMKMKSVLESGLIGNILHVQVDSFWWRGHSYYDLWWRGTWEKEGGGPTLNHAVHHIDALLWMMGSPSEVQALMSNVAHDNAEVEDISIGILRYPNGSLGQLTSSVVHHGEEQQLIFQGAKARVSAPWKVKASLSKANGFPEPNPELESQLQNYYDALPEVAYEGHAGQIDNVLTAIETGSPLLIDGISGRQTLELITAIYKSASTGQTVKFPIGPEDAFYTRAGVQANATHFYEKKKSIENFEAAAITTGSTYK
ncbi:Gfo/Idh/MocA family protein [Paenibacillus planticolens]|uniref:Gfo/Idh/MocA family oxidoreductase n=1 Tax=Paenibacillus planticolens TaxID=2654976 RepID=A0ABX1ZXF0_9BACL|nr:Gfo/Idh/MocA family oxidoreductase [Paenibacillus planticolens]NOV04637.1 gfo/Idh/MocA family oxidoreductase [Paenibacillus planticolens]